MVRGEELGHPLLPLRHLCHQRQRAARAPALQGVHRAFESASPPRRSTTSAPPPANGWPTAAPALCPRSPSLSTVLGIPLQVVNGLLGMEHTSPGALADENTAQRPEAKRAWKEIAEYCRAAQVKRMLSCARFGFLGGNYSGMLDMYNDFTMYQAAFGLHVEIFEMCDLARVLHTVTDEQVAQKRAQINTFFTLSDAPVADKIAGMPTEGTAQLVRFRRRRTGGVCADEQAGRAHLLLPRRGRQRV